MTDNCEGNISTSTIGILGGMGPYATLEFFRKILDFTDARKDHDHHHIVIDNNPKIPSRTRCYLYGENSPVSGMIDSCTRLAKYPVSLVAIPCNSACYFLPDVQSKVDVPIVNIIDVTAYRVSKRFPRWSRVGVVGGRITVCEQLYKEPLECHGLKYVQHSDAFQTRVEYYIEQIKLGNIDAATNRGCGQLFEELITIYALDVLVLGCTEFGCLDLDEFCSEIKNEIVDSSTELAHYLVHEAFTNH